MTKDEALKLVRDWIAERPADRPVSAGKMISIIDRALAQPVQELLPEDEESPERKKFNGLLLSVWACAKPHDDVTNEQLRNLLAECLPYLRTIGTAPPAQPAQKPVAWADDNAIQGKIGNVCSAGARRYWEKSNWADKKNAELHKHPLYTTPPKREWVGLTNDEIELIIEDCDYVALDVAPAIEQALKEKNNGT